MDNRELWDMFIMTIANVWIHTQKRFDNVTVVLVV